LAILALQIKNVITDNDYEFSLASLNAILSTSNSTGYFTSSSTFSGNIKSTSTSISSNSLKDNLNQQQQQNHQLDVQKICLLLFDAYMKLYSTIDNDNEHLSEVLISRQSIQESLLPGLSYLNDIFLNNVIISSSQQNTQNEFSIKLEGMQHKLESLLQQQHHSDSQHTHRSLANESSHQLVSSQSPRFNNISSNHSTPATILNDLSVSIISPLKSTATLTGTNIANGASELINASVAALSSSSTSSISSNVGSVSTTQTQQNQHQQQQQQAQAQASSEIFKSFVFKGISNFKDHSKDKLSNLLTNKNLKK
jgi:hypothetical protein